MIDQNFKKVTNNTLVASECIAAATTNSTNVDGYAQGASTDEARKVFPSLERMLLDYLGVSLGEVENSVTQNLGK